jgi:hypothetical protein
MSELAQIMFGAWQRAPAVAIKAFAWFAVGAIVGRTATVSILT